MLQLKGITKDYELGNSKVEALRGVSLDFRESEFVAVLGPSGCGKTTLLNIIGGLDSYTKGDLIIGGKSTKDYKSSDWDTYRNHSIGFVFQSYNLIPHQTVLSNVELALTLSGVSKAERRKRAKEALKKVGLGDQMNKKPNQMSGGQMQRVAIARALVNNPDILLADEPTGALDSETSVQIMNLLRDISKDKLIIMVTHNPDLAEEYSNRIIRLLDGKVVDDTNPYDRNVVEPIEKKKQPKQKKPSMSYLTALSLSLYNLMTKKARTIMTSFAGSIGIIGIALILAISHGAQLYINSVEENTLASYPITINSNSLDMTSMMSSMMHANKGEVKEDGKIHSNNIMSNMVNTMLTQMRTNDLKAFREYILGEGSKITEYTSDIKYSYSTPLNVFRLDENGDTVQVNPAQLMNELGMSNSVTGSQLMSSIMTNYDVWTELINNDELLSNQYEVVTGRMPQEYNEVVIMVSKNNRISDYALYCLGLMDSDELIEAVQNALAGKQQEIDFEAEEQSYTLDELMVLEFKLLTNSDFYAEENGVWVDKSEDDIYMAQKVRDAETIKVVGVVRPTDNALLQSEANLPVVGYTHALTEYLVEKNGNGEVVKAQQDNPDIDIFTGLEFPKEGEEKAEITMEMIQQYIMTLSPEEQAAAQEKIAQAQQMGMTEQQILEAFAKQMGMLQTEATYDSNMEKLGVASVDQPSMISIYPKDFDSKEKIEEIINEYNDKVAADGNEALKIRYTDIVGLMMSSVSDIIDTISVILIAFVAISLVVSSIMIGIITYISVLERTKEIGILRAMGASKRDISRVFNAETLIVGFTAGAMGIIVTLLLLIPANAIVQNLTGIAGLCVLPWEGGVALVVISMLLTLIAGFIPSKMAAKKDPVAALRSE